MDKKRTWIGKLHLELILAATVALVLAAAFFGVIQYATTSILDHYFETSDYLDKRTNQAASELQDYITENKLSVTATEEILKWVKEQKVVFVGISVDNRIVFNSSQYNMPEHEKYGFDGDMPWFKKYTITFSDTEATAYLMGFFDYRTYVNLFYTEVVMSVLLFIVILTLLIRKKLNYITLLEKEIKILEGGNLKYAITLQGNDELTSLASSLNDMRVTFINQIETEEKARLANKELITALSHDLRTPLTTQTGYLEILKEKHWSTQEEHDRYVEKCLATCEQMKQMSDRLFEYFLAFKSDMDEPEMELKEFKGLELFMQLISEKTLLMEEQGFAFTISVSETDFKIKVCISSLLRIFDNIFSNLMKYADRSENIRISIEADEHYYMIQFDNQIYEQREKIASTKIGLENIRKLMEQQSGELIVHESDTRFSLQLKFPIVN
ncbi:histidine kinase dimerization/phospho-acceptor domain-containing protein [Paenibacillus sp. GCM10027629]|uniref:HAMP domain-containing sensor histidine kinase n=1 Tax=Paenibacillus sp. GCM10027629 TaxID=3273414 RepID=UPI00362E0BCC